MFLISPCSFTTQSIHSQHAAVMKCPCLNIKSLQCCTNMTKKATWSGGTWTQTELLDTLQQLIYEKWIPLMEVLHEILITCYIFFYVYARIRQHATLAQAELKKMLVCYAPTYPPKTGPYPRLPF